MIEILFNATTNLAPGVTAGEFTVNVPVSGITPSRLRSTASDTTYNGSHQKTTHYNLKMWPITTHPITSAQAQAEYEMLFDSVRNGETIAMRGPITGGEWVLYTLFGEEERSYSNGRYDIITYKFNLLEIPEQ